jgi:membrane protein DedA with SNARE-associated domain
VILGLAGTARMPYRLFLAFNAAGGLIWGGRLRAARLPRRRQYQPVEKIAGRGSAALLAILVLAVLIVLIRRRRRPEDDDAQSDDTPPGAPRTSST